MLDELTEHQQQSLEQFQVFNNNKAITGIEDLESSIELLAICDWDLSRAVERVLDNNFTPQPIVHQQKSLIAILTSPLVWGFKFIWNLISFLFDLLPFKNTEAAPEVLAKQFQQKFIDVYGEKGPTFYPGSYSQALDTAKKELRYLLVVLHAEDHDDTHQFCIETLTNETFTNYIREKNMLVWGGNIKYSEPFKVSTTLNATRYPFMAFVALHENRMKVVHRFEGIQSTQSIIEHLSRLVERLDRSYELVRQERASRDAARQIREQQDAAYQESLRIDREKAERLRREQELQKEKEMAEKNAQMDLERKRTEKIAYKQRLTETLVPEPDPSTTKVTKMNIRLPNGSRHIRTFDAAAKIQQLYDFVESKDLEPIDLLEDILIVNTYPRKGYRDKNLSFEEAGLYPNATVIVEEQFDEE